MWVTIAKCAYTTHFLFFIMKSGRLRLVVVLALAAVALCQCSARSTCGSCANNQFSGLSTCIWCLSSSIVVSSTSSILAPRDPPAPFSGTCVTGPQKKIGSIGLFVPAFNVSVSRMCSRLRPGLPHLLLRCAATSARALELR